MFKDDALNGVLLVLFLMGVVGCFYVADVAYEYYTAPVTTIDTVLTDNTEKLNPGTIALCKQYRQWQALPEIKGTTTGMDALCERLGY